MNIFTHKTVVVKTLRKQQRVMVITANITFVILMFIFLIGYSHVVRVSGKFGTVPNEIPLVKKQIHTSI